jgi:TetR/AcrR family transcriptional repressor of nem operon
VLASTGLAGLTVNAVVAEAGMAKGSFYTHFPDRSAFVWELYRAFHDELVGVYVAAAEPFAPGAERLAAGMDAYLDACLDHPETMALLGEARFADGLEEAVRERATELGRFVIGDLTAIGWPDPSATAMLLAGAGAEVAMAELRAGAPRPELRVAFHRLGAAHTGP